MIGVHGGLCMKKGNQRNTLKNIQRRLFRTQMILILTLAIFLGGAGILLNIYFENQKTTTKPLTLPSWSLFFTYFVFRLG
jgi:hypothetical protein